MLTTLDYSVIAIYFVGILLFGIRVGGRQRDESDYFLGGRNLPWWAICFSIVANLLIVPKLIVSPKKDKMTDNTNLIVR